jgi:hypothetical protein
VVRPVRSSDAKNTQFQSNHSVYFEDVGTFSDSSISFIICDMICKKCLKTVDMHVTPTFLMNVF